MITVKLFGIAREIVGSSNLTVDEHAASTVTELLNYLKAKYAALNKLTSLLVAVNSEYADGDTPIGNKDEVAIIPPVSGG